MQFDVYACIHFKSFRVSRVFGTEQDESNQLAPFIIVLLGPLETPGCFYSCLKVSAIELAEADTMSLLLHLYCLLVKEGVISHSDSATWQQQSRDIKSNFG